MLTKFNNQKRTPLLAPIRIATCFKDSLTKFTQNFKKKRERKREIERENEGEF